MKRDYVRRQRQTRDHTCHWPGCERQVPPAMWGCKEHWFKLPKRLRDRIWNTYEIGQEVSMTPSDAYLAAARDVQAWIESEGVRGDREARVIEQRACADTPARPVTS